MKQGVFLRAMASDATEAVIDVIGVIGWQVAYEPMREMLRSIPENIKRVTFDIYSPGGDVWEGNGIVQEIGELGKRVETVARVQVAASMATLIAMACNKRSIASNGRWLIHNAWTITQGDAEDHEKAAQTLRDAEQEAAKFYAERTGGDQKKMLKLMAEERWIMPEEAKELGFVHEICDPFKPEDFKEVREAIVAAGKWPKALADIEEPDQEPKEQFSCECIKCGHQMNSEDHCKDVKCPECGGQMRRAERPGPGQDQQEAQNGPIEIGTDTLTTEIPAVESDGEAKPADEPAEGDVDSTVAVQEPSQELAAEYARGRADGEAAGRLAALEELEGQAGKLKAELDVVRKEASKNQSEKDKLTAQLAALQKASDERAAVLLKNLDEATKKLSNFVAGSLAFEPAVETYEQALAECGGSYAEVVKKYPHVIEKYRAESNKGGK